MEIVDRHIMLHRHTQTRTPRRWIDGILWQVQVPHLSVDLDDDGVLWRARCENACDDGRDALFPEQSFPVRN